MLFVRTPYVTNEGTPVVQPVMFDHRHHVRDDLIDCLYCHYTAETSAYASVPPTELCMNCHSQIWTASPLLAPVRESFFSGRPIDWKRVHKLPDHVYFDHSIHVAKGVGCVSCHGRVDEMAQVARAAPLTMGWCLDCHRNPEPHLRPRDRITDMTWNPSPGEGERLARENGVGRLTNCSTCHR